VRAGLALVAAGKDRDPPGQNLGGFFFLQEPATARVIDSTLDSLRQATAGFPAGSFGRHAPP
jgi:hypothetical protein